MLSTTLKTYRTANHLSQKEMAARLGISREYYARLERGKAVPSFTLFERICRQTNVNAEQILAVAKSRGLRNASARMCKLCLPLRKEDRLVVRRLIERMAR